MADPAPADPAAPDRWTTERYLRLVDVAALPDVNVAVDDVLPPPER
jgi:hypothetical protein